MFVASLLLPLSTSFSLRLRESVEPDCLFRCTERAEFEDVILTSETNALRE